MNSAKLRNKVLQMLYKPGKSAILNSGSIKTIDDMNKLLEDEIAVLSGKKKRTKAKEDKAESESEKKD